MELRHLRYFAAVAETCHFGQAAGQLHVAQPALSHAIRQLETELDVALFERTTRRVSLTAAGEYLQGETRRILDAVDHATDGVRRIAAGRSGLVRVGLTGTASFSHLPLMARAVQRELPDVALQIVADMLTPAQCDGLRAGTIDLGLLRPPAVGGGIDVRMIDHEPLALVVSADHRLAVEPVVSMTDLRPEPFVMYGSRDSAVNDAVLRSCRAAGFMPRREHEAPGTAVLLALVTAGLGVAVVPSSVRALPLQGMVIRDLADGGTVDLALARRLDDDNPVVETVIGVVEAAIAAASLTVDGSGRTAGRPGWSSDRPTP
ncbi:MULTISPECIES: LysR substrate-binding domain-containing protein [Gordonia]|uniref:LysR family transcriptional regulator n=1 Tax=Gordonia pseudamarae TaxID=2831662 RepID=A0ABX6IDI1_9ACTN|nr:MULTISPECIES: LysR substrate-binding domain-containing protein [Gordonia]MBD0022290.1 LysR family transcriptional regulator [Gordonia sp. (in: high G+C Gram-positive bacteria)]QHN33931.1 LysR family transcriptional regulator [Gordonia pseudamarae]